MNIFEKLLLLGPSGIKRENEYWNTFKSDLNKAQTRQEAIDLSEKVLENVLNLRYGEKKNWKNNKGIGKLYYNLQDAKNRGLNSFKPLCDVLTKGKGTGICSAWDSSIKKRIAEIFKTDNDASEIYIDDKELDKVLAMYEGKNEKEIKKMHDKQMSEARLEGTLELIKTLNHKKKK